MNDIGPSEDIERLNNEATPQLLLGALALTLLRKGGIPAERIGMIDAAQGPAPGCWYEISELNHGFVAAKQAVAMANSAPNDLSDDQLNDVVAKGMEEVDRAVSNPFAQVFLIAADKRGIPWRLACADSSGYSEMGIGVRSRRFLESFFDVESKIALDLSRNKVATTAMLRHAGISVPDNRVCRSLQEVEHAASEIGFAVVVKPLREAIGRGVTVDIRDRETLGIAARAAAQYKGPIVVEKFVNGDQFRLLVIDGRTLYCALQGPPTVTGDGEHTIAELCEIENRNPDRGKAARLPLKPIDIEALAKKITTPFRGRGYHPGSILPAGERLPLAYDPRKPEGSFLVNYTASAHPDYLRLGERIAKLAGIRACGIDLMATDITKPISEAPYWVNEINTHPGVSLYANFFPDSPRSIGETLLDSIFPGVRDYRVPVVAVVSRDGAPDLVKHIAGAVSETGLKVVAAHGKGYEFDGFGLGAGDFANIAGGTRAFFDRSAEAIVVERRAEELSNNGFGLGFADAVVFCPPDQDGEAFWRQSGFLAGVADAAFAIAPGETRTDETRNCPAGLVWLSGGQAEPRRLALRVVEALSEILPALPGRTPVSASSKA